MAAVCTLASRNPVPSDDGRVLSHMSLMSESSLIGPDQTSLRLRIIVTIAGAYFTPVNGPYFIAIDIDVHIFVAHYCRAMRNYNRPILWHRHRPHVGQSR